MCNRLPEECNRLPAECNRLPAECNRLPAECNRLPAECNRLPAVCNRLPAECNRLPAECNRLPEQCVIDYTVSTAENCHFSPRRDNSRSSEASRTVTIILKIKIWGVTRSMWARSYIRGKFYVGLHTTSHCEGLHS
ncbi:hypothetical protein Lal_00045591 [Lupinus albus]|nr:hypothetical protein Lal_00045591 [Lupinus albus]